MFSSKFEHVCTLITHKPKDGVIKGREEEIIEVKIISFAVVAYYEMEHLFARNCSCHEMRRIKQTWKK